MVRLDQGSALTDQLTRAESSVGLVSRASAKRRKTESQPVAASLSARLSFVAHGVRGDRQPSSTAIWSEWGEPHPQGGQTQDGSPPALSEGRTSWSITFAQAANFSAGVHYAAAMGSPLNIFTTINWGEAPGATSPYMRFRSLLELMRKWLRRRCGRAYFAYVWENPQGQNPHSHLVAYVPAPLRTEFARKVRDWVQAEAGFLLRGAIKIKGVFDLRGLVGYLVKGSDTQTRHAFETKAHHSRRQGPVASKRIGLSRSLDVAARRRAASTPQEDAEAAIEIRRPMGAIAADGELDPAKATPAGVAASPVCQCVTCPWGCHRVIGGSLERAEPLNTLQIQSLVSTDTASVTRRHAPSWMAAIVSAESDGQTNQPATSPLAFGQHGPKCGCTGLVGTSFLGAKGLRSGSPSQSPLKGLEATEWGCRRKLVNHKRCTLGAFGVAALRQRLSGVAQRYDPLRPAERVLRPCGADIFSLRSRQQRLCRLPPFREDACSLRVDRYTGPGEYGLAREPGLKRFHSMGKLEHDCRSVRNFCRECIASLAESCDQFFI